ncbi:hypothetical protein GCM10022393_12100 [Aquimarina addita]|uniref:Uncharacterized protein n=1 Tax=Aquimarina addita TaxID=870485 RepID=A0ABP7XE45_9FLAO
MKKKQSFILFFLVGIVMVSVSCIKDVDFEQVEDIAITPVFELDFIYSHFDIEDYIDEDLIPDTDFTILPEQLRDTVNYDLVGSDFAIEYIDRVELVFEMRNTIESGFRLQFQFLTDNDEPLGVLYFIEVLPGSGEDSEPVTSFSSPNPIVLDNPTIQQLANAQKIAVELVTPTINSSLRGVLDVRSKAAYYINYSL